LSKSCFYTIGKVKDEDNIGLSRGGGKGFPYHVFFNVYLNYYKKIMTPLKIINKLFKKLCMKSNMLVDIYWEKKDKKDKSVGII